MRKVFDAIIWEDRLIRSTRYATWYVDKDLPEDFDKMTTDQKQYWVNENGDFHSDTFDLETEDLKCQNEECIELVMREQ